MLWALRHLSCFCAAESTESAIIESRKDSHDVPPKPTTTSLPRATGMDGQQRVLDSLRSRASEPCVQEHTDRRGTQLDPRSHTSARTRLKASIHSKSGTLATQRPRRTATIAAEAPQPAPRSSCEVIGTQLWRADRSLFPTDCRRQSHELDFPTARIRLLGEHEP